MTRPIAETFAAALLAASATAALVMLVHIGSTPAQPLMQLERVVIVGKSSNSTAVAQRVEQLPRVLVQGRSSGPVLLARRVCEPANNVC